ncbi:TPA: entericidin A/B family lipoprotein [Escherichia coli]|nr:entericidin A/B family lipoprotein [Escherichia coli]
MKKIMALTVGMCFLVLTGCNTFSGVGKDVSAGGDALTHTADKTKSKM